MFVNAIVAQFEPSELVEFLGFLSLILHKLKVCSLVCPPWIETVAVLTK